MLGHAAGRGWLIVGGVVGGLVMVVVTGVLAERYGWIERPRRLWSILGGIAGFLLAVLVSLSTLSTPIGPVLSTLLVGFGAVLGATVGQSAHEAA